MESKFNIDFSYDDKIFKEYYKKLDEKTLEFLAEYISNATRTIIKTVTIKSNALKYEINIVKEEKGVYNEKEEGGNKDGEGNIVPVEITETIYYGADTGIVPMDFSPTAKVGERRTYTVKRSNEAMGVPSLVGGTLSFATKKRLHKF